MNRLTRMSRLMAVLAAACLWAALAVVPAAADQVDRLDNAAQLQRVVAESGARVTVVNYWATWCPPCRAELPELKELQQRYGPDQVRVIGVSFDYDPAVLQRFLDRYPLGYSNYLGHSGLMGELGVGVIPTTEIYGSRGEKVYTRRGGVTTKMLLKRIKPLLDNGDSDAH